MLLIVFAWALVNLEAVLRFIGKVLALFNPFLIGGGLGAFLILLAEPGRDSVVHSLSTHFAAGGG
ncbi:MAG: hypothetical protein ACLR1V_11210 [Coprococcus sp.]